MYKEKVAGLVLAAGESNRMGQPKQLLPIDGGIMIERVLNAALDSDLDKVVLVLGYQAQRIKQSIKHILINPKLKVVLNRAFKTGMSSSIISGLAEIEENYDHVMILLADMPYINSELINLLLNRYLSSSLPLGAISIKGKRSHPVILSSQFYNELHKLKGDVGARSLFRKHSNQIFLVEPEGDYQAKDIDTLEDYDLYNKSQPDR
ncbi:MAG TPA: nucleotidyltransferase family protein [Desulfobacteraceae bacterium]|nr:nucleotidyltransferase family protein [Desulfobacteraceae bacterium]HPJ67016.1 nucleotidyltransferase family protein [Desulfobacteraceae bacterium]HPQ27282.1 nucleotidyltransferase family protein [Desulfobacteraceae bacterium]